MTRALELAAHGRATTHPNPRVGCVIVRDGAVVGEGWHARAGEPHAEIHALRAAGERARGAEVFVSLEPCRHHGRTPPCVAALIAAGVGKVWVAMTDPNPRVAGQGIECLRAAGIDVEAGLLRPEAEALNRGFVSRMTRGRPWVTLKLAASLDGRTAMASGESRWITGPEARADVHRLRAEAGAVLTGVGTVLADDPQLSCRLGPESRDSGDVRQPDRIVLDAEARVPETAKVWADGARRFWFTAEPGRVPDGVTRIVSPHAEGGLALDAVLAELARHDVNEVLAECGPRLAGALLMSGLVDELVLYLAPALLGPEARPLAHLPGLEHLAQRLQLRWGDARRIGD
ncbi:MAG: bifunctional diaminohydroxyphosphoribosylaminopyrimidine deaminase/5-amino-6-(5-phosphoribosylamino)uracil reductase RibD, partial [Gammaproteobacteria bacterium]